MLARRPTALAGARPAAIPSFVGRSRLAPALQGAAAPRLQARRAPLTVASASATPAAPGPQGEQGFGAAGG